VVWSLLTESDQFGLTNESSVFVKVRDFSGGWPTSRNQGSSWSYSTYSKIVRWSSANGSICVDRNEVGILSMCAESMSGDEMWIWMQWQWTVAGVIAEFIRGKMITSSFLLVPW